MLCEEHATVCHIDGTVYSPDGTAECPVCGKRACAAHRKACSSCGRAICRADFGAQGHDRECATCRRLAPLVDPDSRLIAALIAVQDPAERRGGAVRGLGVRAWRSARDATHTIVETDLGWTRRMVLAIRHGADRAEVVISHSILGSRRRGR
jgi:hypothetical protein